MSGWEFPDRALAGAIVRVETRGRAIALVIGRRGQVGVDVELDPLQAKALGLALRVEATALEEASS